MNPDRPRPSEPGSGLLTQSAVVDDGGDAADEFGAHLSQRRHRCDHEGVQTHVPDHLLTPLLRLRLVSLETRKLGVLGDQNQLIKG